jgi:hypothetical protein
MSDQDGFDAELAARFERENSHLPADSFVATTMRTVRARRSRTEFMRIGLRVAALAAAIIASPWLIAGVERLNVAFASSLAWAMGESGAWVLAAMAVLVVLAMRRRSR